MKRWRKITKQEDLPLFHKWQDFPFDLASIWMWWVYRKRFFSHEDLNLILYLYLVLESGRRWILFKYCSSLGGECLLVDEAEFDQFHFHKIWRPTHLLSLFHWLLRMCSIAWDWTEREISLFFRNNKIHWTSNLNLLPAVPRTFFLVLTQLKVFYHV